MDVIKPEYEFLDLSDVRGTELCSLQSALYQHQARSPRFPARSEKDIEACRSAVTVSRSVEAAGAAECDMAHSPARAPPPYPAPPYPLQPPPQWPVAPPNVYVSQVTANVNVHGYMGQYYQPPQPAYPPERSARPHRRGRGKRAPSPPPAPPYYVQYPHYYQPHAAQAQGAPLYHLPVYQPLVYGPYAYPPYYPEYPVPVEGEPIEKGPEEYSQEVVMEQEAMDAYYGTTHYVGPYGPPPDPAMEYAAPVYMPPHPPHHPPAPHQFNVHAKNFVQGQGQAKTYQTPEAKPPDQKPSPTIPPSSTASTAVDSLPMKDLKIAGKGPGSPKHADRTAENQTKPSLTSSDKSPPAPKMDPAKPAWTPTEAKPIEATVQPAAPIPPKTFPPIISTIQPASVKVPPVVGKPSKGPAAPFSGGKQPPKPSVPQAAVPVQQTASTPKPPFGNRQKRDGPPTRSPSGETPESEKPAPPVEHVKREPPLPPSKAPMPISITLHAAGAPLIVTNKSPFGRKAAPEPAPVPPPPPPAPTASDFPPPPTPRNRVDLPTAPPVAPQPQPAPGKSWASLFSSKPTPAAPALHTTPHPAPPQEERTSPIPTTPPAVPNVQKPVAKVPPFDASPLQTAAEKTAPVARVSTVPPPAVSYSEKTSVNAVSNAAPSVTKPAPVAETVVPVQKDPTPSAPVPPSPFADDPNSYRMGEFLTKYQLDNRAVCLVPRGLTNRSNYCYVNAILQALIACPPFYNMLKALPYQTRRGKSSTPVIDAMVELCYEFSPIQPGVAAGRWRRGGGGGGEVCGVAAGLALDAAAGLKVLRALAPFPGAHDARQEDAEEFLGCLLNSLNDEMLELMKLVEPEEPKEPGPAAPPAQTNGVIAPDQPLDDEDDDDEWKVMGPRNRGAVERRWGGGRTPLADVFRGRTRTRLHRPHPPHHDVTDAVHPFFTLQLDIERASSVKEALELLAGKDTLEGVGDAWQQLSIEQLPVVLLLHLKCFQLDSEGHTAKIVKNIDYPIDLKIDPKIMSAKSKYTQKQRLYKLFAVVYHEGVEAVKGHYVTDTYHGQAGWIRYDDATVTAVSESQVVRPRAPRMPYLLMYRRHDTLPAPHRPPHKPEP